VQVRAPRREDDGEDAVGTLAEMLLEDVPCRVRLGSRHREHVREVPWQRNRGEDSDDEHNEPDGEDEYAEADDGSCPALRHDVTVTRNANP
jgi:hypothetical protein